MRSLRTRQGASTHEQAAAVQRLPDEHRQPHPPRPVAPPRGPAARIQRREPVDRTGQDPGGRPVRRHVLRGRDRAIRPGRRAIRGQRARGGADPLQRPRGAARRPGRGHHGHRVGLHVKRDAEPPVQLRPSGFHP